jgi:hypothetical protein
MPHRSRCSIAEMPNTERAASSAMRSRMAESSPSVGEEVPELSFHINRAEMQAALARSMTNRSSALLLSLSRALLIHFVRLASAALASAHARQ